VPIRLRRATAEDARAINQLIRRVRINPLGLDWRRFLVAEDAGGVVGCVQVKPHQGGVRELASLAVVPERQGQGVGTMLVDALLAREWGELYLICVEPMTSYYARFGFAVVEPAAIPRSLKPLYRIGRSWHGCLAGSGSQSCADLALTAPRIGRSSGYRCRSGDSY
jgi:N-acetylglutamate synthase-like GNAT family acetyltransferase